MTSTEDLTAIILPWAKVAHPDKYQATLAVVAHPKTFRRYLVRLIEIRWTEDTGPWRKTIPLDVLEESTLRVRMLHRPTGRMLEVAGRLAPGGRTWGFAELQMLMAAPDQLETVARWKEALDLELVPERVRGGARRAP